MRAEVLSVRKEDDGNVTVRLRLTTGDSVAKSRQLTVPAEDYFAAGAPVARDLLTAESYRILCRTAEKKAALNRACLILENGDNSASALHRKLRMRGFSEESTADAIAFVIQQGFLDENAQLQRYVAQLAKKEIGRRKMVTTLLQKGYPGDAIRGAIQSAEENGSLDFDAIREALLQKYAPSTPEEKRKLLYTHGF